MSNPTWIRYTESRREGRRDVRALRLSDAAVEALAERIDAATTWHRESSRPDAARYLDVVTAWPNTMEAIYYVRAEPATPGGRQERDHLLGAELIRRFDLTPHIAVHLALGVVLWDQRHRSSQTAAAWSARNDSCAVLCPERHVVGTHASNYLADVTCKGCLSAAAELKPNTGAERGGAS